MANQPKFHLKRTDENRDRWIETKGRFARHPILKRANRSWRRLSVDKSLETRVFVRHSWKKERKKKKKNFRTKNGFQLKGSLIMASPFVYLSIECPSFSFRTRCESDIENSPFTLLSSPFFVDLHPPKVNRRFEKRTPSSKRCQNLIEDQCIYAVY